ncbi:MAG: prephenate dehydratase [Deltaproteobacteria bacterium]|nr:prephenate dehydratase [Deltaproteobacteria bacterium]
MSRKETVDELREKIDQVDEKIIEFLSQRACLAQKIGQTKNLGNEEIYVPSREKEILQRVSRLNRGPLPEQAIRSVYREVLSASRSLEGPLRVAYLGPDATFTQMAARERFGLSTVYVSVASIQGVFQEVERGRANFGVVPVENSTEGVVTHTLDMLVEADVKICAEIYLEIHQCLLSRPGRSGQFQRIVSHPQAVAQCRDWLANHFPQVPVDEVASTAQAAQMAAQDATLAAIAGRLASEFYGLEIVEENIEDQSNNITRFLVIRDQISRPTGEDKTSIIFSVKDEVGILHRMLEPFAKNRINLTKIESRPLKNKPWEYLFFLDFNGHVEEPGICKALKQLEKICIFVKVIGSYPCGI